MPPKITVITAVYNNHRFIAHAIESVLEQTYKNIELIVIDGGSTDGTVEVINRYRPWLSKFISEADGGIYEALNKGISYATGEVIGFLHSDDLFAGKNTLSAVAAGFHSADVDAVYGDLVYVSKEHPNEIVRFWRSSPYTSIKLRQGWMPPHPTFYVRRKVYEKYGAFDTRYRIAADYDCILRLLDKAKINCVYVPSVLVKMRLGGVSNRSIASVMRKMQEDYRVLQANEIGGIGTLVFKNLKKLSQFIVRPE